MLNYRFLLSLTSLFWAGTYAAAAPLETILVTGQTYSLPTGDERFEYFGDQFAVSPNGYVAMIGTSVSLAQNIERDTVWVRDLDKNWSIVAGTGITLFGIDEEETRVRINNSGEMLFQEVRFDGGGGDGVVVGTANDFTTLGITGTPLPDGSTAGPMDALSINDAGQVVMAINGRDGSASGLWTASASQPAQRFVPKGANGEDILVNRYLLHDNQNNIFISGTSGGQSGVYRVDGETGLGYSLAAFEKAPGVAEEVAFSPVDQLVVDEQGNFAFAARLLRENGVTSDSESGIWKSNPDGSVSLVAREGSLAPDGSRFDEFGYSFALNDDGLVFSSFIRSGNNGIDGRQYWTVDESGEMTSISFQHGDRAPDDAGVITFFNEDVISDLGRIAFIAEIDGESFNQRLYYQNEIGEFETIAFSGQEIEVTPGDVRTVRGFEETLDFIGDQIVVQIKFTDGTEGLFLSGTTPLLPDYNGDGVVTLEDLALVQASFGTQFDRSQVANFVQNLGPDSEASASASAVPEPNALALWLLASSLMLWSSGRCRRRATHIAHCV